MRPPLAIRGQGLQTAAGAGLEALRELVEGRATALATLPSELARGLPHTLGGRVPGLAAGPERGLELALSVVEEALLGVSSAERAKIPLLVGSGLGPQEPREAGESLTAQAFTARVAEAAGLDVSRSLTYSVTCVSGLCALERARLELGRPNPDERPPAVLVLGIETLSRTIQGGFCALEALSASATPSKPSTQDGIVLGEAACALRLERAEPGEVALLGQGLVADATHATSPDRSGRGMREAIEIALAEAGLAANDLAWIALTASGSPVYAATYRGALDGLFPGASSDPFPKPFPSSPFGEPFPGEPFGQPFAEPFSAEPFAEPFSAEPFAEPFGQSFAEPFSAEPFAEPFPAEPFPGSFPGSWGERVVDWEAGVGHLLAASGPVGLVYSPASEGPGLALTVGFGGLNGASVVGLLKPASPPAREPAREVRVRALAVASEASADLEDDFPGRWDPRRRIPPEVAPLAEAARLALREAGRWAPGQVLPELGLVIAVDHHGERAAQRFGAALSRERPCSPAVFLNSLPSTPATTLSLLFGARGYQATLNAGPGGGAAALEEARWLVAQGVAPRILAGALSVSIDGNQRLAALVLVETADEAGRAEGVDPSLAASLARVEVEPEVQNLAVGDFLAALRAQLTPPS